jgi:GDP-mannose 6-dehydrogenase
MPARIAVLGLGYVGCVTAAGFARLGYEVTGIDRDDYKVRSVNGGRAPFFEPGLDDLVGETTRNGLFRATLSLSEVTDSLDFIFVCVGTPSQKNGNLDCSQLRRVSAEIGSYTQGCGRPLIVAIRSTVFPGVCDEVIGRAFENSPFVKVVANPEFLREGSALRDFMEPSLVVIGSDHPDAARRTGDLYSPLGVNPCLVSLRTAEIIKYACNSFHAVKIAFANEVGTLCNALGLSTKEVMATFCQDTKLNISTAYLKPGFAFGGSCLPKDLRALNYQASYLDLHLPLLEAALPSNREHLRRAIELVLDLGPRRLAVVGLAFKEGTDDLRESPVVALLEQLIGKGRDVRVYDPNIQLDAIYGSNRDFILQQIPHIGRLLNSDLADTLRWAQHVVIAQQPSHLLRRAITETELPVTDLTGESWN